MSGQRLKGTACQDRDYKFPTDQAAIRHPFSVTSAPAPSRRANPKNGTAAI